MSNCNAMSKCANQYIIAKPNSSKVTAVIANTKILQVQSKLHLMKAAFFINIITISYPEYVTLKNENLRTASFF